MSLPAFGSMAAHDALAYAHSHWREEEAAFDRQPDTGNALAAEAAWRELAAHALNCGLLPVLPAIERRVAGWMRVATGGVCEPAAGSPRSS